MLVLEYAGWGLDLDTPRTPAKPEGADGAEDADGAGAGVDGATLTDVDRVEVTSGSPSLSDDTTTVSATTLSTSSSRRSNNGWKRLGRFHAKHSPRYLNSGLRKALPPRFSPLARKNLCTKLSLSREHERCLSSTQLKNTGKDCKVSARCSIHSHPAMQALLSTWFPRSLN